MHRIFRERFASDLTKEIPRIPMAPDFHAFSEAGRNLGALHLSYDTCTEYPLDIVPARSGQLQSPHFRIGNRAMRFADEGRSILIVNDHVRIGGIPAEAHAYSVNGRTPLEWFNNRYRVTQHGISGIVNDPNAWFFKPEDLIPAIRRIVYVSVETARIVAKLPDPFAS